MSVAISDIAVKQAILQSVKDGSYPEEEHVAAAELPTSILPSLHQELQRARNDVEAQVRDISKQSAQDVDSWIAQAKRVQADIERSKLTAREIIQQAEGGRHIKDSAVDAATKVKLLEKEVAFNESLASALSDIRTVSNILDAAKEDLVHGQLIEALTKVRQAKIETSKQRQMDTTRASGLLRDKIDAIQVSVVDMATASAKGLLQISPEQNLVRVHSSGSDQNPDLDTIAQVLASMDVLQPWLAQTRKSLNRAIFTPLMKKDGALRSSAIDVRSDELSISRDAGGGVIEVLGDLTAAFEFLSMHVPASVRSPLSPLLLPPLLEQLETSWLASSVPVRTDEMQGFEQVLDTVSIFAQKLDTLGWTNTASLKAWVDGAPRIWLARRRETALDAVRHLLSVGLKDRKTVERIETQTVSKADMMVTSDDADDAWDEEWTEDNEKSSQSAVPASDQLDAEDDDASAWDIEDGQGEEVESQSREGGEGKDEDEVEDAWGWGDDEPAQDIPKASGPEVKTNGNGKVKDTSPRELTLKETFTVTTLPEGVFEIITQMVSDAEALSDPSSSRTPVALAASALYSLPTLALAMFRATAPTSYGKLDSGSMLIYNDSSRLADQLRTFALQSAVPRLRIDNDIKALDTFGKRAYSAEMESQRTILRDLLDGAQGFTNCTTAPFAGECDSAIVMTVDRLREVYQQWEPILSKSALLQSIGSLLGTATAKMLLDIEDLADIGEEESKRLKSYCDSVSTLRDLFTQEHPSGGAPGDTTGIYCPNWFKFQYLAEILESSLADIKYLWMEGELSLEFESDEVTNLIEALFADSDYRRRAIADIKRSGRR